MSGRLLPDRIRASDNLIRSQALYLRRQLRRASRWSSVLRGLGDRALASHVVPADLSEVDRPEEDGAEFEDVLALVESSLGRDELVDHARDTEACQGGEEQNPGRPQEETSRGSDQEQEAQ